MVVTVFTSQFPSTAHTQPAYNLFLTSLPSLDVSSMSNGKRSFNISLGGSSAVGSKPNPFARTIRPPSAKAALGFQDDSEDDGSGNSSGPPKRKLIKLDHGSDDNDDQLEKLENNSEGEDNDALSKMTSANVSPPPPPPPPLRKAAQDDDDDLDAFSRLESRKGTLNLSSSSLRGNRGILSRTFI